MEKKLKAKIIILSITLTMLVSFFSLTVYALISQSLNVKAEIIITDEGQAKSIINVYEVLGKNDNSSYISLQEEPVFSLAVTKSRNEDNAKGEFKLKPVFGGENKYRYYMIKIAIQNVSTVPISYSAGILNELGEEFVFTSQLELKYFENKNDYFSLQEISKIEGKIEVNETIEKYIVLTIKEGLSFPDLIKTSPHAFYLNIKVVADEN